MRKKKTLTIIITMLVVGTAFTAFLVNGHSVSAFPSQQKDCSGCHGSPGVYTNTVTAVPSAATVAPGASYNVAITLKAAVGTGYWIANSDAAGTTGTSTGVYAGGSGQGTNGQWTANMTAPATPGTYYYKVFGQSGPADLSGSVGFKTYQIVVAAANTPTATRVPPTNTPVPPTNTAVPPTNTPMPTKTPIPPTNTPVPPTKTSVPPTSTSVPPTSTPVQPTSTVVPPTNTPIPPTSTSVPPTNTPLPPTATTVPPTGTTVPPPNTPVPPTATSTSVVPPPSRAGLGQQLFNKYCASCHTPGSPRYTGSVAGASTADIAEAIREEGPMRGLRSALSSQDIKNIADYLQTLPGGHEDEEESDD